MLQFALGRLGSSCNHRMLFPAATWISFGELEVILSEALLQINSETLVYFSKDPQVCACFLKK